MSEDVCPCCGKKMVSLVPVSAEAKAVVDSLVPDKDGFVLVPAGLLKYADGKHGGRRCFSGKHDGRRCSSVGK